jgi:hypothetical protein
MARNACAVLWDILKVHAFVHMSYYFPKNGNIINIPFEMFCDSLTQWVPNSSSLRLLSTGIKIFGPKTYNT